MIMAWKCHLQLEHGALPLPAREALALLTQAAPPDPAFAQDMEAVLDAIGPAPVGPGDTTLGRALSTEAG
jgi:hypothetical protein